MQTELYSLFTSDPDASFQPVDIAAEKVMTLTVDEVKGFLQQMDEEEEFDDVELDAVALTAIAGGEVDNQSAARGSMMNPGVVALACVR